MQKRMEEEEEARLGLEEKYSSLQEEVEGKGRKLKKLWTKYKAAQSEIRDVQAEFSREKEDILETVRELSPQLKPLCCAPSRSPCAPSRYRCASSRGSSS